MKKRFFWRLTALLFLWSNLLFGLGSLSYAQEITVSGTVSDPDGNSLPGVSIVFQGTTTGTITDFEGKYSLLVPDAQGVLVFSFIGMQAQEISIQGRTVINVTLLASVQEVDEVVVTALGIKREKKALGYSIDDVGGEDLAVVKEPNVITSLSGKVAGVNITQSSSGAGGTARILIRGANSLSGENQPLIVVDGVPIDNTGLGNVEESTAQWDRTDFGSGISDINADDIENVAILKGPNAAALYGSRAANGAIIITTKQGVVRKGIGVSISSNTIWEDPMLLPDFQNTYGRGGQGAPYTDLETLRANAGSWGGKMDGSDQLYWTGDQRPYSAQPDNVKDFFRTGFTTTNTVSLTGGTEKINSRFSYTNMYNKGILPNSNIRKHNFNLRTGFELADYLRVDSKVTFFIQDAKNRPFLGDNSDNPVQELYSMPRNVVLSDLEEYKNPDGTLRSYGSLAQNPYWTQFHNQQEDERKRFIGFIKLAFDLPLDITGFVRAGTDQTFFKFYRLYPKFHIHNSGGRANRVSREMWETNYDFLLTWQDKDLWEDFDVTINAGGNIRESERIRLEGTSWDFIIPFVYPIGSNTAPEDNLGKYEINQRKKVHSLYGAASIAWKNMLFGEFSARNDWSSTLPSDNWSYFYPSASLSFIFTELMDNKDILSFGKVRASWAQVGNDTDFNRLFDSYNSSGVFDGKPRVNISGTKNNPNLKPETTQSWEVGCDLNFFTNRISANFTYYDIETKDQITKLPLAASTGYANKWVNVGRVSNKGFEFTIGGVPIQTDDFKWDIRFNYAQNDNELVELTEDVKIREFFSMQSGGGISVRADVNGGFGDIIGTDYKRDDIGQIIVDDNGLPIAGEATSILGNYQPDWTGGLTNTLKYKDFTLNFLIDFRVGGELYSWTDANFTTLGVSKNTLEGREDGILVQGVTEDGGVNVTKIEPSDIELYYGRMSGIASNFIYDATNIRLRELSMSYNMPSQWFENLPMTSASVSFVAKNLFFIYKDADNFDPESSFSTSNGQGVIFNTLPTTRSYGFNLNVAF